MKNKRNVLIAFILICCLCLSIGYAALTDTLYVNGTATVNVLSDNDGDDAPTTPIEKAFEEEIYWSNAEATQTAPRATGTASASVDTTSDPTNDTVKITIPANVLVEEGDKVTVNATIKNDSDYNAQVTQITIANANSAYYSVAWAWAAGEDGYLTESDGADSTEDMVITITLVDAPMEDISGTFSIEFGANAVETIPAP